MITVTVVVVILGWHATSLSWLVLHFNRVVVTDIYLEIANWKKSAAVCVRLSVVSCGGPARLSRKAAFWFGSRQLQSVLETCYFGFFASKFRSSDNFTPW